MACLILMKLLKTHHGWGLHIFQKCRSHLNILGPNIVTVSNNIEARQIFGHHFAFLFAQATRCPVFVQPCLIAESDMRPIKFAKLLVWLLRSVSVSYLASDGLDK